MVEWDSTDLRVESILAEGFREAHNLPAEPEPPDDKGEDEDDR